MISPSLPASIFILPPSYMLECCPWCVPTVPTVPRLRLGYRLTFANYAGSRPLHRGQYTHSTGAHYRCTMRAPHQLQQQHGGHLPLGQLRNIYHIFLKFFLNLQVHTFITSLRIYGVCYVIDLFFDLYSYNIIL